VLRNDNLFGLLEISSNYLNVVRMKEGKEIDRVCSMLMITTCCTISTGNKVSSLLS
jgi:hypothetical protein